MNTLYLVFWFPRTKAHLDELYHFFAEKKSHLPLSQRELNSVHGVLDITDLRRGFEQIEYVEADTESGVRFRIYEDGLVLLSKEVHGDVEDEHSLLNEYYSDRLERTFLFLFSTGAPLAVHSGGRNFAHPHFMVVESKRKAREVLKDFNMTEEARLSFKDVRVYQKGSYFVIEHDDVNNRVLEDFIEGQAFLRIVREQLHSYIDFHREIWEVVKKTRSKHKIPGADIIKLNAEVGDYAKLGSIVQMRLSQIGTYIDLRQNILEEDSTYKSLPQHFHFEYNALRSMMVYTTRLWDATSAYMEDVIGFLSRLERKITNSSIKGLTIVTSVGVGAAIIGLFADAPPEFSLRSLAYFLILLVLGWAANEMLKQIYKRKKFNVDKLE